MFKQIKNFHQRLLHKWRLYRTKITIQQVEKNDRITGLAFFADGKRILELSEPQLEEIKAKFNDWESFLNTSVGAFCLLGAISAQGLPNPHIVSILLLIWAALLYVLTVGSTFPSNAIRDLIPNSRHLGGNIRRALAKRYLSTFRVIIHYPLFFLGFFYLAFIAMISSESHYFDFTRKIANVEDFLSAEYVNRHPQLTRDTANQDTAKQAK